MHVWILEALNDDTDSYWFEDVFKDRDDGIAYVLNKYPIDWRIQNETDIRSEIWDHETWEDPKRTRIGYSHHFNAEFVITRYEVK